MENVVSFSRSFWQGKRVFLTGHTGFKGSWLSLWLQNWGAQVTGYALTPPTQPSLFEVARVADGMNSIIGDIRDFEKFKSAVIAARPEIFIHMAAQPLVRYSYEQPVETFATNIMGTVHALECARSVPTLRAFVNVTSDKCYENQERAEGYREDEAMGGYDPYSSSKGCAELVTAAYRNSFFNPGAYAKHHVAVGSARAGNVIGGGDWAQDRLIPDIFRSVEQNLPVTIRNPKATRPWQHVLEPLGGYLYLAQALYEKGPTFAEAFNFGPDESDVRDVEWIVKEILKLHPRARGYVVEKTEHQPHEATYLKLNCEKAKTKLNWEPRWNLSTTLKKITEWNDAFAADPQRSKLVCLEQINEFLGLGHTTR